MPGRGGADIGVPNRKGGATEDGLWCRGVLSGTE